MKFTSWTLRCSMLKLLTVTAVAACRLSALPPALKPLPLQKLLQLLSLAPQQATLLPVPLHLNSRRAPPKTVQLLPKLWRKLLPHPPPLHPPALQQGPQQATPQPLALPLWHLPLQLEVPALLRLSARHRLVVHVFCLLGSLHVALFGASNLSITNCIQRGWILLIDIYKSQCCVRVVSGARALLPCPTMCICSTGMLLCIHVFPLPWHSCFCNCHILAFAGYSGHSSCRC